MGGGLGADEASFDDLVPNWMFALRSTRLRVTGALVIPLVFASPLAFVSESDDLRLGPLLVPAIIAVAALAGWWPTLIAGTIVTGVYWWFGVPVAHSFRFENGSNALAVGAMVAMVVGVSALTKTVERSVASVRELDLRRRERVVVEEATRRQAELDREQVQAVLGMANALAPAHTMRDIAAVALDRIDLPVWPTTASIAIVRGDHVEVLATRGASPATVTSLEAIDLHTSSWLGDALGGSITIVEDRDAFAREHPDARVLKIYRSGSWAVVPFRSESTIGLLSLYFLGPQPLSDYESYFTLVGEILAGGLERAQAEERRRRNLADLERAFRERDRIARTLSATLLPPRLPELPGFTAEGWLLPAHADEVAGDFYDLFPVSSSEWVAVLGDVCGKGAEAAAVTSLARHAARVGALENPDTAAIANVVNGALADDPSELFCTMAIVHYRHELEHVDVTLAGHPQVRVVSHGKVTRVGSYGAVLSMAEAKAVVDSHPLGPGDSVVLFSDGLVERNGAFGEDELDEAIADAPCGSAIALANHLRECVLALPAERHDDLTLLVVTRDHG